MSSANWDEPISHRSRAIDYVWLLRTFVARNSDLFDRYSREQNEKDKCIAALIGAYDELRDLDCSANGIGFTYVSDGRFYYSFADGFGKQRCFSHYTCRDAFALWSSLYVNLNATLEGYADFYVPTDIPTDTRIPYRAAIIVKGHRADDVRKEFGCYEHEARDFVEKRKIPFGWRMARASEVRHLISFAYDDLGGWDDESYPHSYSREYCESRQNFWVDGIQKIDKQIYRAISCGRKDYVEKLLQQMIEKYEWDF